MPYPSPSVFVDNQELLASNRLSKVPSTSIAARTPAGR